VASHIAGIKIAAQIKTHAGVRAARGESIERVIATMLVDMDQWRFLSHLNSFFLHILLIKKKVDGAWNCLKKAPLVISNSRFPSTRFFVNSFLSSAASAVAAAASPGT
jgi:hypothetical protein